MQIFGVLFGIGKKLKQNKKNKGNNYKPKREWDYK
jgi:hypothetical protein